MLLITDYHKIGSLYDFLKYNELSEEEMLKLAHSAASGLSHLHLEIHGARGKPAIVHRDIKSRNILVKQNLTCAIADFGLAIKYDSSLQKLDMGHHNTRVGTIRYMAPEVLSKTINGQDLEALTKADMYSFALVLWELCSRTNVQHYVHTKPMSSPEKKLITYLEEMPYNLPYSEYVDADPTVEDMNSVVNLKKIRPSCNSTWNVSKYVSQVSNLMKESWQPNPSARPPMLRAKKTLFSLKDTLEKEKSTARQLNNQNSIQKGIYSYDKKESLSADSDNYSQNSSLTNSIPSQENGVRFS
jgi:bone morphogenetic protein receptor type-1B